MVRFKKLYNVDITIAVEAHTEDVAWSIANMAARLIAESELIDPYDVQVGAISEPFEVSEL